MSKNYVRPVEISADCTSDELANLSNEEHLAAILNRILKRLDAIENPPRRK